MIFERRLAQVLAAADADVALAARRKLLSERAGLAVGAREAGDPLAGRARPIRSRLAESLVKASEFPVRDFPTTTPPLPGKRSTTGSAVALQATRHSDVARPSSRTLPLSTSVASVRGRQGGHDRNPGERQL
jgi:hypothetical protein